MLFLLFHLDQDAYALEARRIHAVLPLLPTKRIPKAPPGVSGLLEYRGTLVPVLDVPAITLGRAARARMSTRIVLMALSKAPERRRLLGLIVERAIETFTCEQTVFRETGTDNARAPYLGPVASTPRGLVQWLTVDRLLTPELASILTREPAA